MAAHYAHQRTNATNRDRSPYDTGLPIQEIELAVAAEIGDFHFANFYQTGRVRLTLPEHVTKIGASAFYGCSAIVSINIPSGVHEIAEDAFLNCVSLDEESRSAIRAFRAR